MPLSSTSAPGCDEPTSGAKHRRYELLGGISLLSPGTFYPLSDGLPFRTTEGSYDALSRLLNRHARSRSWYAIA